MGTKRPLQSDDDANNNNNTTNFDENKRFSSPLGIQRLESAELHVRALNTQFASWVQSQLQNHPNELWDDGIRDYLQHTSKLLEQFSDVVQWLKSNSAIPESLSKSQLSNTKNAEANDSKPDFLPRQIGQSSEAFGPGADGPAVASNRTLEDVGDGDEVEHPGSPSVKRTDEEGVVVVHEVKCRLYVKADNPSDKGWKDMGGGQLSIRCKAGAAKATRESKPTIIIRNDVGKLLLNASIYPNIKMSIQKNALITILHTLDTEHANGNDADTLTPVARTYLIRTKTEALIHELSEAVKQNAPASGC